MEIDHGAREFPHQQLAALIRAKIADGTYPPGRAIPSLVRLQQETGLAVTTIRRAIRVLEEEGLVERIPGRGTYVTGYDHRAMSSLALVNPSGR